MGVCQECDITSKGVMVALKLKTARTSLILIKTDQIVRKWFKNEKKIILTDLACLISAAILKKD